MHVLVSERDKSADSPDVRAVRLAADQNDVLSARQLGACGLGGNAIAVRVRRGQLHRKYQGVYAVGTGVLSTRGLLTAAAMACGDAAILGHFAGAAWHELLPWEDRAVDVIVTRGGGGRTRRGIRLHFNRVDARDVWRREGVRVTTPARTVLDLATALEPWALRRMVRQALGDRRLSLCQLAAVVDRAPRHLGAPAVRALIADGFVATRSDLEDRGHDAVRAWKLPAPEVNPRLVLDGRPVEPDLLWRDAGLVVELDSRTWHDDPLARQDDADRQALLEAHGYRVLRITHHQLAADGARSRARVVSALGLEP
jgi:very-short-patch-repair endonuclease